MSCPNCSQNPYRGSAAADITPEPKPIIPKESWTKRAFSVDNALARFMMHSFVGLATISLFVFALWALTVGAARLGFYVGHDLLKLGFTEFTFENFCHSPLPLFTWAFGALMIISPLISTKVGMRVLHGKVIK